MILLDFGKTYEFEWHTSKYKTLTLDKVKKKHKKNIDFIKRPLNCAHSCKKKKKKKTRKILVRIQARIIAQYLLK